MHGNHRVIGFHRKILPHSDAGRLAKAVNTIAPEPARPIPASNHFDHSNFSRNSYSCSHNQSILMTWSNICDCLTTTITKSGSITSGGYVSKIMK
jgi:hypothetical protein